MITIPRIKAKTSAIAAMRTTCRCSSRAARTSLASVATTAIVVSATRTSVTSATE
jgi:hypothetical protein